MQNLTSLFRRLPEDYQKIEIRRVGGPHPHLDGVQVAVFRRSGGKAYAREYPWAAVRDAVPDMLADGLAETVQAVVQDVAAEDELAAQTKEMQDHITELAQVMQDHCEHASMTQVVMERRLRALVRLAQALGLHLGHVLGHHDGKPLTRVARTVRDMWGEEEKHED